MQFLVTSLLALVAGTAAFAPSPRAFVVVRNAGNVARFPALSMAEPDLDNMSLEEEVEMLTQIELNKVKRTSNLRNANGVDYAPWMGINEEDETQIKQLMKEKAGARRMRQEQEKDVSGNLYLDSQFQELSGTGLKTKVINGDVELEWATKSETDTAGFIVRRRPTKVGDYVTIGTYEDWGPLKSKGEDGGVYRFLDTTAGVGGWVYRISEVDTNGKQNDVCQCLVDVQTEEEQRGAVIAAVGISIFAVLSVVAGLLLDPIDGY